MNLELEANILGCAILDEHAAHTALFGCEEDWFEHPPHQEIFRVLTEMLNNHQTIDLVTVKEWIKENGDLEAVGGIEFLADLITGVPNIKRVASYVGVMQNIHRGEM